MVVTLERADGEPIDMDWDVFTDWDENMTGDNVDAPNQFICIIYNPQNAYGELILTVYHLESGDTIQKHIMVLEKESVKPSETPEVSPSVKPSEAPVIKPVVKLDKNALTLYATGSNTDKLKASVSGTSKKPVFKSSNTAVVTVDQSGNVIAKKAGSAVITASANGLVKQCKIIVKKPVLTVAKTKVTVKKGKKLKLNAKATPARTISYVSNNKRCVTVDKKGVVTGVNTGTAIITIKCNGITKRVSVTVKR